MAVNSTYSDPRFGVEKVIICPQVCDLSAVAITTLGSVTFTEDVTITQLFAIVAELITGAGAVSQVGLNEGAANIAVLSIPTASGVGTVITTTTIASANEINNGDTVIFKSVATTPGTGTVYIGMAYRARYVSS